MKLTRVTITGIDERTRPSWLADIAHKFPFVEFGILLSASREGKEPRYPGRHVIDDLYDDRAWLNLAGHLCGSWARESILGPFYWAIERNQHFEMFRRLQLNGLEYGPSMVQRIGDVGTRLGKEFILQLPDFEALDTGYLGSYPGVSFLADASGGRGEGMRSFIPVPVGYRGGYAGGITPDNVEVILKKLLFVGKGIDSEFWIDMESGVRTDDWLDRAKVEKVLTIAKQFVEGER